MKLELTNDQLDFLRDVLRNELNKNIREYETRKEMLNKLYGMIVTQESR